MIGNQIANFRIIEKLGEGGMGVVFKAVDVNLDRPVAIKMLNAELAHNPEIVERFRSEARAQANLNHVNLATMYAFLVDQGSAFMAMEFVEGETFEQLINRRGPIPPEDAVPWFKQALLGIGAAHRMGIVHRDIKPGNLMLNRQGIVKVMDFGIAKVLGTRGMTRTGMQLGTLAYMSPEQIQNRPIDVRTDIYALGITLYQMLSGHVPFESDSDFQIMNDHITTAPPPLIRMYPYAPAQYENVVMKALEKRPDDRYQTVEQFGAALEHPENVPVSMATAPLPTVRPTVVEMPRPAIVAGSSALAASAAVTAPITAPQPAAPLAAPITAPQAQPALATAPPIAIAPAAPVSPVAAATPAATTTPATARMTWNSRYTAAAAIAAAVVILLAILMFSRKPPVVQAPSLSSGPAAGSPLAQSPIEINASTQGNLPNPGPQGGLAASNPGQSGTSEPSGPPPQRVTKARETAAPASFTIPAGTIIAVRTIDEIDSDRAVSGQRFGASVDEPVAVSGQVVVPKGSDAVLEIAGMKKGGRIRGRTELSIQLVSLKVRGRTLPVQTEVHGAQGASRGANTGKKAAGAVLGVTFRGGKGAVADGVIGVGGAMAFQMATHGSRVKIPPESRIEFALTRDATMSPHDTASSQGGPSSAGPDNSAELDELEHEIDQLSSRAAAVNNSLQHLQQQQAAAGYGLRGDVVSRQSGMQLNLSKAQGAIQQGDAVRAKRYANLAAADVEFLEHFLGR